MTGSVKLNSAGGGSITLVTPSTASNVTATIPAATDTLVNTGSTQTLTNKTLTAAGSNSVEATAGPTATQLAGNRNKIINGAMMIDQRNAGASVTANTSTSGTYITDRFREVVTAGTGVFTVAQNTSAPAGFINSLKATVTTAYSVTGTDRYEISQLVEGNNIADLAWGTANAKTVTLSFWVRSSLTGAFGGVIQNANADYNYPFTYTISSADTWTQVSITVTGATAGTWATDNTQGLKVTWSLGCGSTRLGTAGSWSSTRYEGATGQTQVIGTNGATFYITGVQLEKGATATPFENRLYGTELALCQRYYQKSYDVGTAVGTSTVNGFIMSFGTAAAATGSTIGAGTSFRVDMRTTPTITIWDLGGNSGKVTANPYGSATVNNNSASVISSSTNNVSVERGSGTSCNNILFHYAASSEL